MKRVLVLLALGACAQIPVNPTPDRPVMSQPDTCGQARIADLIGQPATTLERREVLDAVRIIRPGTAVTKDDRPTRLNIDISADGIILRSWCG